MMQAWRTRHRGRTAGHLVDRSVSRRPRLTTKATAFWVSGCHRLAIDCVVVCVACNRCAPAVSAPLYPPPHTVANPAAVNGLFCVLRSPFIL